VNKAELVAALEGRLGSKKVAAEALEAVVDTIQRAVSRGEKVAISGFGSFEKTIRGARVGRNPRTGEKVKIKKTSVPRFKPGTAFKSYVSDPKTMPKPAAAGAPATRTTTRTTAAKAPAKAAPARAAATKAAPAKAPARAAATKTAVKAPARAAATKAAPAKAAATKTAVKAPARAAATKTAVKAPAKTAVKAPAKTAVKAPARAAATKTTAVRRTPAKKA
jgi:DNA-binding protein HU-beta